MSYAVPQPEQAGISVLVKLFEHNAWANVKLLDFCSRLSDEQLGATAVGTFGTIRGTLMHMIGAEQGYVERVNGRTPPKPLSRDRLPTFEMLSDAAAWTSSQMLELALSAHADTLVEEVSPEEKVEYNLTDLLVQAVGHSTEHRSQIATTITQLGLEPPDLSGWAWMEETGAFRITDLKARD